MPATESANHNQTKNEQAENHDYKRTRQYKMMASTHYGKRKIRYIEGDLASDQSCQMCKFM